MYGNEIEKQRKTLIIKIEEEGKKDMHKNEVHISHNGIINPRCNF